MNEFLLTLIRLTVFGSALALVLLLLKPLMRSRVSRALSYYVWILVLVRLVLPVGVTLTLPASQRPEPISAETVPPATALVSNDVQVTAPNVGDGSAANKPVAPTNNMETHDTTGDGAKQAGSQPYVANTGSLWVTIKNSVGSIFKNPLTYLVLWGLGVILCLAWFVSGYLRFAGLLRNTGKPIDNASIAVLSEFPESSRVRLLSSEYIKTPLLIGIFRPTMIIPLKQYDEAQLRDILLHEFTHYRRRDLLYKWFAMLVTSLHWFNPLMIVVRREINRACELSCDEAVIKGLSLPERQHYGETLLTIAAPEALPTSILATTMCEEKAELKERLVSIMSFKKSSVSALALSLVLLILLTACASVDGIGRAATPQPETSAPPIVLTGKEKAISLVELLVNKEFKAVQDMCTSPSDGFYTEEHLENIWEELVKSRGDYVGLNTDKIFERPAGENKSRYLLYCDFEQGEVVVQVVFDENGDLANITPLNTHRSESQLNYENESDAKPPLMRVTGPSGGEHYLLGITKTGKEELYGLPEEVMQAFEHSDFLTLELNVMADMHHYFRPVSWANGIPVSDGTKLTEHIKSETYEKLVKFLDSRGLWEDDYEYKMPIGIGEIIEELACSDAGLSREWGMDVYLDDVASIQGTPVGELDMLQLEEPISETLSFSEIPDIFWDCYINMLVDKYDEHVDWNKRRYEAYYRGDNAAQAELVEEFLAYCDSPDIEGYTDAELQEIESASMQLDYRSFYYDRNARIAQFAMDYIETPENVEYGAVFFIALDTELLVGEGGIIENFIDAGYTVETIEY